MNSRKLSHLIIGPTLFVATHATAGNLSKKAVLHRCYQQLTQSPLKPNDPLLAKIDAGSDPIDVCIDDVLKSAYLTSDGNGNSVVAAAKMATGKKVVNTFHLLHSSWFTHRDLPDGATIGSIDNYMNGILEPNGGANYYTSTLFDQSKNADYFLNTNDYLRTVRDQGMSPPSIYIGVNQYALFQSNLGNIFYQYGVPYGIRVLPTAERVFPTTTQDNYPRGMNFAAGSIKLFENYGGGILGLDIYMARTFDEPVGTYSDGVIEVPRKWGEQIYKDIMCRDLPVVRQEDAVAFVDPASDGPFRRQVACTQCHVSMDRMAGLIKSFQLSERRTQSVWTTYLDTTRWNKGSAGDYSWSSNYRAKFNAGGGVMYSNYLREDHVGYLYYRGYDGRLVNEKVDSPTALGAAMSKQIEPYLCAAKRYYRFFTGVDVDVSDPGATPAPLKPQDAVHYNFVVKAAKDLVNADSSGVYHPRSMSTVIEAILKSPQYRSANFGVEP